MIGPCLLVVWTDDGPLWVVAELLGLETTTPGAAGERWKP